MPLASTSTGLAYLARVYHSDIRQEIGYLKARLLYKLKKLDEAMANGESPQRIDALKEQVREIDEKLQACREEARAQNESEQQSFND